MGVVLATVVVLTAFVWGAAATAGAAGGGAACVAGATGGVTCGGVALALGDGVIRLEPGASVTTRWGARLGA